MYIIHELGSHVHSRGYENFEYSHKLVSGTIRKRKLMLFMVIAGVDQVKRGGVSRPPLELRFMPFLSLIQVEQFRLSSEAHEISRVR